MSNLVVTFGRALGNPPIMMGRSCRTESVLIGSGGELSDMVCDPSDNHGENACELLAEADCWVCIGAAPTAAAPGSDPTDSFKMLTGERVNRTLVKGDRVAVKSA